MNRFAIVLGALALTGCGGGLGGETQDFAVTMERSPASVYAAFADVSGEGGAVFYPGLKVERSKPSDSSLLFTIPSSGSSSSTLRFDFVPIEGGKGTELRAFVEVPPITRTIDGKRKVVSETKVENELEKILKRIAKGSDAAAGEVSDLLVAVAVATNLKLVPTATGGKPGGDWMSELLARAGEADMIAGADGAPEDERDLARQQYREERARESASAPMSEQREYAEPVEPDEDY